jgi:hypothetical protein
MPSAPDGQDLALDQLLETFGAGCFGASEAHHGDEVSFPGSRGPVVALVPIAREAGSASRAQELVTASQACVNIIAICASSAYGRAAGHSQGDVASVTSSAQSGCH